MPSKTKPVSPGDSSLGPPDVTRYVSRINNYLKEEARRSPNGKAFYNTKNMDASERKEVAKVFRDAGWDVSTSDDQRDGSALVFSKRGR